jgi:alpha-acetolactate decarboxylase
MKYSMMLLAAAMILTGLPATEASAQPKRDLMRDAHTLVFDHTTISRSVEILPNGVRTITTTTNPDMVPVLRRHPREMGELYQQGGMVRGWDPVFRELALVRDKVTMEVRDIENGVEVLSTSEDAEVVKLIQAHADKVSEMARRGAESMREPTALPSDYRRPGAEDANEAAPAAADREPWDGKMVQFGSMREVIGERQHQGRVAIGEVLKRPNFYGIGALEALAGEITVRDGWTTITQVDDAGHPKPADAPLEQAKAALLIGAYVPEWTSLAVAAPLAAGELERFIEAEAAKTGLDVSKPIVFAVDGVFNDVRLHVINGACPMHARLNQRELDAQEKPYEAVLSEVSGTIIGVYASDAVGDITHPGTSVHMHLEYMDAASGAVITGHLEQIGVSAGSVLYLPWVK